MRIESGRDPVKWRSALSSASSVEAAVKEVSSDLSADFPDGIDLMLIFVSPQHALRYREVALMLHESLEIRELIGCSGGGVAGAGREVESGPVLSVVAARLPEVGVRSFALDGEAVLDLAKSERGWQDLLDLEAEHEPVFVLLANPFECPVEAYVDGLDRAFPDSKKLGGLASGGSGKESVALFLRSGVEEAGAVGVALWGDVAVETAVAQGCRPIGVPFILTHCENNLAVQLDGKPALHALDQVYGNLTPADRERFRRSPHVGIGLHAGKSPYRQGDYLLRNVLGVDRERGVVAIGAHLQVGMEVRFHIRDAETSAEDVEAVLSRASDRVSGVCGALFFSCLGRGQGLYQSSGYDSSVFRKHFGDIALGGFFGNGEIGPVQGKTYLHGYTSVFGLFRPRGWS